MDELNAPHSPRSAVQTTRRWVCSLLPGAGQEPRRLRPDRHPARQVRHDGRHPLREGARGLGGRLRPAQLGGRDHLHGLGDLLRRLDGGDAVAEVFQCSHGVRLCPDPLRSSCLRPPARRRRLEGRSIVLRASRHRLAAAPQHDAAVGRRPSVDRSAERLGRTSRRRPSASARSRRTGRLEVRIASRMSACLPRISPSSPSSKARTRLTGSGSR